MKKNIIGKHLLTQPNDRTCKRIVLNISKTALILLITVILTEFMRKFNIGNSSMIMVYVLSVLVISSITSTYVYGIIAALVSTFACDFLITAPRMGFSFTIGVPITLVTMMLVTILTTTLTMNIKAQARISLEREQLTRTLYEINKKLLVAGDVDTITTLANKYLLDYLKRPIIFYIKDPAISSEGTYNQIAPNNEALNIFHTKKQYKQVHRIFKYGASNAERLFDDVVGDIYYIPLVSDKNVLGVIGIACQKDELSSGSLAFLQMLAGQFTFALELRYMSDKQNRILLESEKEKTRSTLLRAISHDLRTPLTSILGISSTILEQNDLSGQSLQSLMKDICENAQWLIRIVENVLMITRITGDNLKVTKTLEAAEEVIAHSVSIVRKHFPDSYIHIQTPEQLLMVPMDATLISQVIINLLENSIKNSPDKSLILLNLVKNGSFAQFEVIDNGKGIPGRLMDNLFGIHSHENEQAADSAGGIGIGLSICQTIVRAHDGFIEGRNRENGGAIFVFRLPLEESEQLEH